MVRSLAGRQRGEAVALPSWIKPQLTKLVDQPPDGPEWLHELKYDGYRMHVRLDRGAVRLLTRTGLDWTHKYPRRSRRRSPCHREQGGGDGAKKDREVGDAVGNHRAIQQPKVRVGGRGTDTDD